MDRDGLIVLHQNHGQTGLRYFPNHLRGNIPVVCNDQPINVSPHQLADAMDGINIWTIDVQQDLVTQLVGSFLNSGDNPRVKPFTP